MAKQQHAREFRRNMVGICLIGVAGFGGLYGATQYIFNREKFIETMDKIDTKVPAVLEEVVQTVKDSFAADTVRDKKTTPQDTLKIN